jgi:hypothetical protein
MLMWREHFENGGEITDFSTKRHCGQLAKLQPFYALFVQNDELTNAV